MKSRQVEWRFGDREQGVEAWLRHPDTLHMLVYFRPTDGPENQWYCVRAVTCAWLRREAEASRLGAVWPALVIVPDGPRTKVEASITDQLSLGWSLVIHDAEPLSGLPEPADL